MTAIDGATTGSTPVDVRSQVYDTRVGRLEAAVIGSGLAVVLVHGTLGSWRQVLGTAADLSSERTVVLVSRPGYGATPLTTGRTYEQQGLAYAAVLEVLQIDRAAILGISGGAPSAVAFAAANPDRCEALLLCGALAPHLASTRGMWATEIPGVVRAWVTVEGWRRNRALGDAEKFDHYIRGQLSDAERIRAADPEVGRTLHEFMALTSAAPSGVVGLLNDIRGIRGAHRIGGPPVALVRAPTLVLHGAQDKFVPLTHAALYARAIAGASLETYAGGAHLFLQTYRSEVASRIRLFLSANV